MNEYELEVHIIMNATQSWINQIVTEMGVSGVLKKLIRVIIEGWPENVTQLNPEIQPFLNIRDELPTYIGIVHKGLRMSWKGQISDNSFR